MLEMTTRQYDTGWTTQWDDMKTYGPYARHLRRLVFDIIRPLTFGSVLDVGCGQGALLGQLHATYPGVALYGTEISTAGLALARERVPASQFVVLDLTQAPLDHQFDLVICTDVLEHIEDDRAALRSLAAMTGKYLLAVSVQGRMRTLEPEAWGHVRNYRRGELVAKVEEAGLRVARVVEWGWPFFSPLYRDLIDLIGGKGTEGSYGPGRKLLAAALYQLFRLNLSTRGDEIFVLAERPNA